MVQIFVKGLKGETHTFDVDENDDVLEIRKQYSKKAGIPIEQIRFIFKGQHLEDGRALCDYRIQKDSMIHSVLRLRGGIRDNSDIETVDTSTIPDFI
jgi:hypothetical protein